MGEKELSVIVWSWGLLFAVIGFLIVLCGSIFMLLLQRHREHNSSEHDAFKQVTTDHGTRLSRLEGEHAIHKEICGR